MWPFSEGCEEAQGGFLVQGFLYPSEAALLWHDQSPPPFDPLYSTDSTEVWFHFVGPVSLELSSALSSPEVPPAAAASAFFPNDTHGSSLVSRLAAVGWSRPCPPCGSQALLPDCHPRGNSQVGNGMTRAFSFLLLASSYQDTHTPCT